MSNIDTITLLFQRPNEPLFTAKDNGKTVFELPSDFYTERYESIGMSIGLRVGEDAERTIPLRSVQHPNLDFTRPIRIRGPFSLFHRQHQVIAGQLITILLQTPIDDLVSMAAYIKDRVNPYLFLVSPRFLYKMKLFYFFLKKIRICFSTLYRRHCNIVPIRNIYHYHRLFNNSPINLLMHQYSHVPEKKVQL